MKKILENFYTLHLIKHMAQVNDEQDDKKDIPLEDCVIKEDGTVDCGIKQKNLQKLVQKGITIQGVIVTQQVDEQKSPQTKQVEQKKKDSSPKSGCGCFEDNPDENKDTETEAEITNSSESSTELSIRGYKKSEVSPEDWKSLLDLKAEEEKQ